MKTVPGKVYRGNLTMPKDATPDDHRRTREGFLKEMRRWRKRHGYRFEMRYIMHITDYLNAHWDCVVWSDAPRKPLAKAISATWKGHGGLRQSLVYVPEDDLAAVVKYQVKDTVRPDRALRYLPARRKDMGMRFCDATRGFWNGKSEKQIWDEWRAEYFGHGEDGGSSPIVDIIIPDNMTVRFRDKMIARLRSITPDADDYLRGLSLVGTDEVAA